jgi:serine/threonine-protein kinase
VIGRTISHYEILEKLGAGGMGEIYRARDPRLNRTVAVKALPASATGDSDRRRRFLQEAQAASSLNHPNIITIHDIVTDLDGSDYMVMEFIAGRTLGELVPPEGLDIARTLQYAAQIADALSAAHEAGIVHRDLKPGNVMVTDAGRVKVLDFGLAKVTVEASLTEVTQTLASAPMTVEGSILGTVSYMSPEQAQGKRVDARSDIFSFGALLYEMVTGHKAFVGDGALTTLTAILRDEVKPVADFTAGVPPELEEVIRRALRKDPAQRWQSMREVHGVLVALRQRYESGILDATRVLPPPRKKVSPLALIAVAAIVVLGIGGWWVASRQTPPAVPVPPQQAQTATTPLPPGSERPSPLEAPAPKSDILTNEGVLAMVAAKLPEGVVVDHIRAAGSKSRFDLSTDGVIRLSRGGVTPSMIEAMRDPGGVPAARSTLPAPAATVAVAVPEQTKHVAVLSGLPIAIILASNIPNDPEPGTPLRFTVKEDFVVNSSVAIAAGATATGEVVGVKKGILGRGSKPTFKLISVDGVDGTKIALRATPGSGDKAERVLEPSNRKDKTLLAPAGTEYLGYIDGAHSVTVKK